MLPRPTILLVLPAALAWAAGSPVPSFAAWPQTPYQQVMVAPTGIKQTARTIVSDGAGGAIVGWLDERAGNRDVYVQRLTSKGDVAPGWPATGLAICTGPGDVSGLAAAPDGSGGAIFAWADSRSGNADIYTIRVTGSGALAPGWPVNGRLLSHGEQLREEKEPHIVGDGSGGALVVWTLIFSAGSDEDVYGAHMTGSGALEWCMGLFTPGGMQNQPSITVPSPGTFVVAFSDATLGSGDIRVQAHVTSGGSLWGMSLGSATDIEVFPAVVPDGSGGTFVVWLKNLGLGFGDLMATRLTPGGALVFGLWDVDGVSSGANAIGTMLSPEIPQRAVPDGSGGLYTLWATQYSGAYVQHFSPLGDLMPGFSPSGKAVFGSDPNLGLLIDAIGDGQGGLYVLGVADPTGVPGLYMRRVDGTGSITPGWKDWSTAFVSAAFDAYEGWAWLALDAKGRALFTQNSYSASSVLQAAAQVVDRFGRLGDVSPTIAAVRDVTGDQGGHVRLDWTRCSLDTSPGYEVASYWIWRQAPAAVAEAAFRSGAGRLADGADLSAEDGQARPLFRRAAVNGITTWWESIGIVAASGYPNYSFVAPTTRDSMLSGNPRTLFLVQARHRDTYAFWDSAPDSGYSVDNLAPVTPSPFTGQYASGSTSMTWGANRESDFAYYELYRGTSSGFVPDEGNRIARTTNTGYTDEAGAPAYYKLTAVDVHGNHSAYALLSPDQLLDAGPGSVPKALSFAKPAPQPVADRVRFHFALPQAAAVTIELFDVRGGRVAAVARGPFTAGVHDLDWDLRASGLHAGVYFARFTALGRTIQRRLVTMR